MFIREFLRTILRSADCCSQSITQIRTEAALRSRDMHPAWVPTQQENKPNAASLETRRNSATEQRRRAQENPRTPMSGHVRLKEPPCVVAVIVRYQLRTKISPKLYACELHPTQTVYVHMWKRDGILVRKRTILGPIWIAELPSRNARKVSGFVICVVLPYDYQWFETGKMYRRCSSAVGRSVALCKEGWM